MKKRVGKREAKLVVLGLLIGVVAGYGTLARAANYTEPQTVDGGSVVLSGNDSVSVEGGGDRVRGFLVNNGGTLSNADGSVLSISVVNTSAMTDSRADGIVLWNDNSVNPPTSVTLYGLTGITATGMGAHGVDILDGSNAIIEGDGNAIISVNASGELGEAYGVQVDFAGTSPSVVNITGINEYEAISLKGDARTFSLANGNITISDVTKITAYGGKSPTDPTAVSELGLGYAVQVDSAGADVCLILNGNNTEIVAKSESNRAVGIFAQSVDWYNENAGYKAIVYAEGIKKITAIANGPTGDYSGAIGIGTHQINSEKAELYLNQQNGNQFAEIEISAPNAEGTAISNIGGKLVANVGDIKVEGSDAIGILASGGSTEVNGTGNNTIEIASKGLSSSNYAYGVCNQYGIVTLGNVKKLSVTATGGQALAIYSAGEGSVITVNGMDADNKTIIEGDIVAEDDGVVKLKNTAVIGNISEAKYSTENYGTIKFLGTNTVDGAVTLQGNKSITAVADSYSLTQVGTDATDTITYNGDLSVSGTGTTVTIAGTNTAKASITGKVTVGAGSALNLTNATVGTTVTNSGTAYLNNVTTTEGWNLAEGSVTVVDSLINGSDLTAMSKTGTVNGAVYAPSGTLDVRGVDLRLKGEPNVFGGTPENPTTLDTLRASRVLFGDIYDGSNNLTIKNIILENDTTAYRAALGVYYDSLTVDNISVNAPENWYWTQQYQDYNYQMYTGYGGTLTVNESLTTGEFMNASSSLGYTGILNLADGAVLNCLDFQNTGNVTGETLAAGTVHVNGAGATLNAAALNNHAITTLGTVNITGHPVMCTKEQGLSNANYGTDAVLTIGTLNFNQVDTGAVKNYFRVGDNAVTTIGALTSSAIGADFYVTGTSDSTVNKDGGKAVQYIGDIVFAKYSDSDSVGTKFSLNLDSSDDYFTGSVRGTTFASARWGKWGWPINDDAVASTDNIKGMTFNLSNGATWTMTGDSVVNNLTMDKATIAKDTSVHTLTLQDGNSKIVNGSSMEVVVANGAASILDIGNSTFNGIGESSDVIQNSGTINLIAGTFDDNFVTDAKDTGTLNLVQKGIYQTTAAKVYTNTDAKEVNAGAVTEAAKQKINFIGGTLALADTEYTLDYAKSAQTHMKEVIINSKASNTQVVMLGNLVNFTENEITVEDAGKVGSETSLDRVEATTQQKNLLVGSGQSNQTLFEEQYVTAVEKGFSVKDLNLEEYSTGLIITNEEKVTLGGTEGGSLVKVGGEEKNVKVVVGVDNATIVKDVNGDNIAGKTGTLNIGNPAVGNTVQFQLKGSLTVNEGSEVNVKGQTKVTEEVVLNGGTANVAEGAKLVTPLFQLDDSLVHTGQDAVVETENIIVKSTPKTEQTKQSTLGGEVKASGTMTLNKASDNTTIVLNVGTEEKAAHVEISNTLLQGNILFLDPAWKDGSNLIGDASHYATETTNLDGAYVVGRNSILTFGATNADADALFGGTGFVWGKDNVSAAAYVARNINVANGSLVVDGSLTSAPAMPTEGTVNFAANSLLMVDGTFGLVSPMVSGITSATVAGSSKLYIANAEPNKTYKILAGNGITTGWMVENIGVSGLISDMVTVDSSGGYFNVTTGSLGFNVDDTVMSNVGQAITEDVGSRAFKTLFALVDTPSKVQQRNNVNALANMGENLNVTAGAADMVNMMGDSIAEHWQNAPTQETAELRNTANNGENYIADTVEQGKAKEIMPARIEENDGGKYVWASYIHNKNKVDGMKLGGMEGKYNAQYNGTIVGVDLTKDFGVALTYADGNITNGFAGHNDAKYYGGSIYGRKVLGKVNLYGDISYTHAKNELQQNNVTSDAKTDTVSVGLTAKYVCKKGNVAPFAGVRYIRIDGKEYKDSLGISREAGKINSVVVPLGLEYNGKFAMPGSTWTWRPTAAVGFMFNFGDRDNKMTLKYNGATDTFGYDFVDKRTFFTKVGMEVEKKKITFGVGYNFMKSSNSRNDKWSVNLKFSF